MFCLRFCFMCFIYKGIIVGLDNLDGVIQVVKSASNNASAVADLTTGKLLFSK